MKLTQTHREALQDILQWRRDVRHFKPKPIASDVLDNLKRAMDFAPSVGNARPWRVIEVADPDLRAQVMANFEQANAAAAKIYASERRKAYNNLKLEGLRIAPVHLAIFTDLAPEAGKGLGRQSMPEMLQYSTVTAIHTLWLAARAQNVGVGWVSILDPDTVGRTLDVPDDWALTGYLCVGYPDREDDTPLLHRNDWQESSQTEWIKR